MVQQHAADGHGSAAAAGAVALPARWGADTAADDGQRGYFTGAAAGCVGDSNSDTPNIYCGIIRN